MIKNLSDYVIICGNDKCEKFAGKELSFFIEKVTDLKIEIVEKANGRPFISVGRTQAFSDENFHIKWKKHTADGIFIKQKNGDVFLCGKRERSTLYSVYDFLEESFGIKFLASDYVYVPHNEGKDIVIKEKTEEPSFDLRSFYTVQMENDSLLTARYRQVALYSEEKEEYGYGLFHDGQLIGHNVFDFLSFDKYKDKHPEFFSRVEFDAGNVGYDLCWSQGIDDNGEIIEGGSCDIASKNFIEYIKSKKQQKWFSFCQNDVPQGCTCEKCKENLKKYGSYSGIVLRYVNAVAKRVEEWRKQNCPEREIRIVTFAYSFSMSPPVNDYGEITVRPERNVWIWLATADQNYMYACNEKGQNSEFLSLLHSWQKVTNRFCYWDYRINFAEYLFYFPWFNVLKSDYKYLEKTGIDYLFSEACSGDRNDPVLWFNEIKGYVASKLMWNTDSNVEKLTKEFCNLYYGASSKAVFNVIKLFEDNYEDLKKTNPQARIHLLLGYRTVEEDYYPLEMLDRAIKILTDEISRTDDKTLKRRLTNVLLTPERMLFRNYAAYKPNDEEGRKKLYEALINHLEETNIKVLGGWGFTIEVFKKMPDYNWWKINGIKY